MILQALAALVAEPPAEVGSTAWDMAQQVVAFVIALGALYVTILRPIARRIAKGVRDSIAEIAQQQRHTAEVVDEVRKQVNPDSGRSAHDYARRAAEGVEELRAQVFQLDQSHQLNRKRMDNLATELVAQGHKVGQLAEAVTPLLYRLDALAAQQEAQMAWQQATNLRLDRVDQALTDVRAAQ